MVPRVTVEELTAGLRKMKKGRTCADDGLVSEMLQTGHNALLETIAGYFSDILTGRMEPPVEWKIARLSVIFKKGERSELKKYRPM